MAKDKTAKATKVLEYGKKGSFLHAFSNMVNFSHSYVKNINDSKIFAGLMIIILNIVSKFVTIKLSKSMEAYLKYTFSRQILVFAIAWMGTRDIYIAFGIMLLFTLCVDYLFNEESSLCCLSEGFTQYHVELLDTNGGVDADKPVTDDEIRKAEAVLEKAKKQGTENLYQKTTNNGWIN